MFHTQWIRQTRWLLGGVETATTNLWRTLSGSLPSSSPTGNPSKTMKSTTANRLKAFRQKCSTCRPVWHAYDSECKIAHIEASARANGSIQQSGSYICLVLEKTFVFSTDPQPVGTPIWSHSSYFRPKRKRICSGRLRCSKNRMFSLGEELEIFYVLEGQTLISSHGCLLAEIMRWSCFNSFFRAIAEINVCFNFAQRESF